MTTFRDGKTVKLEYQLNNQSNLIWMTIYYSTILGEYVMATRDSTKKWDAFDINNTITVQYDKHNVFQASAVKLSREEDGEVFYELFEKHRFAFTFWFKHPDNPHYVLFKIDMDQPRVGDGSKVKKNITDEK